ncbi:f-box domain-containing protein [Trichonephila clavipes]|nr:f-box domain-containing protein [Trichonephila clavipes]
MKYSAPTQDEVCELDFGDCTDASVRRKIKYDDYDYDEKSTSRWDYLPDILLEDIFSRLTIRERYYASQVCRNWNRIFYSIKVWETFILGDKTLTRRKFNYYMGDQYVLDHHRTQLCLHKVARGFRKLVIKPMENFHNLYEFMTILSYFCENFESLVMIRSLDFTFGCELSPEVARGRDKVFGTGGKLLEALKRLMDDLKGLKHLSLQDLLLEKWHDTTCEPRPTVHSSVYATLSTEVHEQMFRSGSQSETKTSNIKFQRKLGTHLSTN